ncbi:hypothetical protein [Rhodanobacter sp. TND4FH1]
MATTRAAESSTGDSEASDAANPAGMTVSKLAKSAACQVPCDPIEQRIWRFAAARDAMSQLISELRT